MRQRMRVVLKEQRLSMRTESIWYAFPPRVLSSHESGMRRINSDTPSNSRSPSFPLRECLAKCGRAVEPDPCGLGPPRLEWAEEILQSDRARCCRTRRRQRTTKPRAATKLHLDA